MPNFMSARQIADDLGARIAGGEYGPPGTKLPKRTEFAELYSCGLTTIAKAILLLKERGLIEGVQGHASYVAMNAGPRQ